MSEFAGGLPEMKYHPEKGLTLQFAPQQLQGIMKQLAQLSQRPGMAMGQQPQQPGMPPQGMPPGGSPMSPGQGMMR